MGRFYLSYVEQENLLPRSFPPEIPYKSAFPFFFLFVFIKNYSFCCPPLYRFHLEITEFEVGHIMCHAQKTELRQRDYQYMFIVGLNQQIPTFSIHLFIRSVFYLFINQAGQVQLQPGLIVGGWNLGGGRWGAV